MSWLFGHGVVFVVLFVLCSCGLGWLCWRGVRGERASWPVLGTLGRRTAGTLLAVLAFLGVMHELSRLPAERRLNNALRVHGVETTATIVSFDGHDRPSVQVHRLQVRYQAGGRPILAEIPVGSDSGKMRGREHLGGTVTVVYDSRRPTIALLDDDAVDGGLFSSFGWAALFGLLTALGAHVARRTDWRGLPDDLRSLLRRGA